jgi:hypothetical protein
LGPKQQVTDVEDFNGPAECSIAAGGLVGLTPPARKFTTFQPESSVRWSFRRLRPPTGSFGQWRVKMFAGENCSKVGCFLEAALPLIAPAVALIGMLSLVAWS